MITIYTITYNEELMLPFFIQHYRKNFPDCRIIVYDNHSTDDTVKIALNSGCEVLYYDTNNQLSDLKYLEIKNHCWQVPNQKPIHALDSWVFVVDCDELCQITEEELYAEDKKGTTIISFQGYNMVNMQNNTNISGITHGVVADDYSKKYCFNTAKVKEINYTPGCHVCKPVGEVVMSERVYPCYHYRYVGIAYLADRYTRNLKRLSAENRKKGMGSHYAKNSLQIHTDFESARTQAVKLREPIEHSHLKIFIGAYEDAQFTKVPTVAHLHKINLSKLPIGVYQNNQLSEHRLFISDRMQEEHVDYIGLLTWRYYQKCKHLLPLEKLWTLYRAPEVVWAAWPAPQWYRHSLINHPGIKPYIDELCERTGMDAEGMGLYGNQFICSKTVYLEFQKFFRQEFAHFHAKYKYNYNFWVKDADKPRLASVFYERIACLWFSNQKHLIIKQIPHK